MHKFDIQFMGQNNACVLGFSRNLFRIIYNITTLVGINHRDIVNIE